MELTRRFLRIRTRLVLILGETGVGQGCFWPIPSQHLGQKRQRSCSRLTVAALAESLAESELFSAISPARLPALLPKARQVIFEIADGSTIFLDEIGELPLSMQTRLLRECFRMGKLCALVLPNRAK